MTPARALKAVRSLIESDPDAIGLIDRCDVIGRSEAPDGFGGSAITESTLASKVPCMYETAKSRPYTTQVTGGPLSYVTHDLYLLASAATRSIPADAKIVVVARGDTPSRTFEQPILLEETMGPLVHLGVMLRA